MSVKCLTFTVPSFRQPFAGQGFKAFLTTLFFERLVAIFKCLRLPIIAAVPFTGLADFNGITHIRHNHRPPFFHHRIFASSQSPDWELWPWKLQLPVSGSWSFQHSVPKPELGNELNILNLSTFVHRVDTLLCFSSCSSCLRGEFSM